MEIMNEKEACEIIKNLVDVLVYRLDTEKVFGDTLEFSHMD